VSPQSLSKLPPIADKCCGPTFQRHLGYGCAQLFALSDTWAQEAGQVKEDMEEEVWSARATKLWFPHAKQMQRLMSFSPFCSQGLSVGQEPQRGQESCTSISGLPRSILG
jgi:hypothetical protein